MDLSGIWLHDSKILRVEEDTMEGNLDFILEYPIDWENNIFETRILRFHGFLNYAIKEIPYDGRPAILGFKDFGEIDYTIGEGRNKTSVKRKKVELETTAGSRTLEFVKAELMGPDEGFIVQKPI